MKLENLRNIEIQDLILKNDLLKKDEVLKSDFEGKLEFGTAGIRGVMGAGTTKINQFTIAAAAQAYAQYLLTYEKTKIKSGIVIAHDNRHNGVFYSNLIAEIMQANKIKTYLYENNDLQPTPLLSYTIRNLKLAGGINITASHNPKEYNGFKAYNPYGGQLMPSETKKVSEFMKDINPLEVKRAIWTPLYISQEVIKTYKEKVLALRLTNANNIKVVYSAQHGTGAKHVPDLLTKMGVSFNVVEKQQTPDPDFTYTITPNPEDGKSFKKAEWLARRVKADLVVTTDPDADRLGVVVKYQKRYKFLNGNQTAALYLDFRLNQLKLQNKLPKDGYIIKSVVSGDLAEKIARKYKLEVREVPVGFKNFANLIENSKKGTFVFGYEESYGFLIDSDLSRDKDALQALVGVVDMVAYYKSQNINTFSKLKSLYKEFGIHRTNTFSKQISTTQQKNLLDRLSSVKKIANEKIIKVEDFRKKIKGFEKEALVKVFLESGSWIAIRPSGTEPKVKIYTSTIGTKKQEIIDVVAFEKEIHEWVDDNTEEFVEKKFTWKGLVKYLIFLSLIIGVFAFVFMVIYSGTKDKTGNSISTYVVAGHIFKSHDRWIWLSLWAWHLFTMVLNGWSKKRMLNRLGVQVKIRHIIISNIMGGIIAFITPFAVGGDAIGYWYLRRKGLKRPPLLAALISNTLIAQARFTLQTALLVGIGWGLYRDIFASGDIQSHAALIWFFIGLAWTIFSTFMIFLLTLNKTIQEWIVRTATKLLEWFPWTHVYDPGKLASKYQYEFKMMRSGMKQLWKSWWFLLEMMFYSLIPLFVNPFAIIMSTSGWINKDVHAGPYFSQVVISDIVNTANSMSITPGGAGTAEWLSIITYQILFNGSRLQQESGFSPRAIASGQDLLGKLVIWWPWLIFSASASFAFIILENRRILIERINKNANLSGTKTRGDSKIKKIVIVVLPLLFLLYLLIYFLVLFK